MAYSTRFGANILSAARRLHDERTTAESAGDGTHRYTSDLLRRYQNQAIRDLVLDTYKQYGSKITTILPEMVGMSTSITPASSIATIPTDHWIVLEAAKDDYSVYMPRIEGDILKVRTGRDLVAPTLTSPKFYQVGRTIQILPTTWSDGSHILVWSVKSFNDVALDSTGEVPVASIWDGEIVARMVELGNADAKSAVNL